jgi:hypothetical protein
LAVLDYNYPSLTIIKTLTVLTSKVVIRRYIFFSKSKLPTFDPFLLQEKSHLPLPLSLSIWTFKPLLEREAQSKAPPSLSRNSLKKEKKILQDYFFKREKENPAFPILS